MNINININVCKKNRDSAYSRNHKIKTNEMYTTNNQVKAQIDKHSIKFIPKQSIIINDRLSDKSIDRSIDKSIDRYTDKSFDKFEKFDKIDRSVERPQEKSGERSFIFIKNLQKQSKNVSKRINVPHHFRIKREEIINIDSQSQPKMMNFKFLDFNNFLEKSSDPKKQSVITKIDSEDLHGIISLKTNSKSNITLNKTGMKNQNEMKNGVDFKRFFATLSKSIRLVNQKGAIKVDTKPQLLLNKTLTIQKKQNKNLNELIRNKISSISKNRNCKLFNTNIQTIRIDLNNENKFKANEDENKGQVGKEDQDDDVLTVIEKDCENDYSNIYNCLNLTDVS